MENYFTVSMRTCTCFTFSCDESGCKG